MQKLQKRKCDACVQSFQWHATMKGLYSAYCPSCRELAFESLGKIDDTTEQKIMTYFVGVDALPMCIDKMHDEGIHHKLEISRRTFDDTFYSARRALTAIMKDNLLTAQKSA